MTEYRALTDISHALTGEMLKAGDVKPRSWWSHRSDFEMQALIDLGLIEVVKTEKKGKVTANGTD